MFNFHGGKGALGMMNKEQGRRNDEGREIFNNQCSIFMEEKVRWELMNKEQGTRN